MTTAASREALELLARHRDSLDEVVADVMSLSVRLAEGRLARIRVGDSEEISWVSERLVRRVKSARAAAERAVKQLSELSHWDVDQSTLSARDKQRLSRALAANAKWAEDTIADLTDGCAAYIRDARYWATHLQAPAPPDVTLPPELERVWRSVQAVKLFGGLLTTFLSKEKYRLKLATPFGEIRFNFVIVHLPGVPGFEAEPLVLNPNRSVVAGGRTITAYDPDTVIAGHQITPPTARHPGLRYFGYAKIIEVREVPANCTIEFQTVAYPRIFGLPRGGAAWSDVSGAGGAGTSRADPPGGGPNDHVAPDRWEFADFPTTGVADSRAVCQRLFKNNMYRTWVVEVSPGGRTVLGYYEWGWTQLVHVSADGSLASEPIAAGAGPAGVPPPPAGANPPGGGWPPRAPTTSGPTWVSEQDATDAARDERRNAFPER